MRKKLVLDIGGVRMSSTHLSTWPLPKIKQQPVRMAKAKMKMNGEPKSKNSTGVGRQQHDSRLDNFSETVMGRRLMRCFRCIPYISLQIYTSIYKYICVIVAMGVFRKSVFRIHICAYLDTYIKYIYTYVYTEINTEIYS